MLISSDDNRKYNGLLNDIRKVLYPHINSKKFRQEIKSLNPNFPIGDNGEKISMRDITPDDFEEHLTFVKTMSIRQGFVPEYLSNADIQVAHNVVLSAGVNDEYEEVDDGVVTFVTCSNCGCSTVRKLTYDRYDEILRISQGKEEEKFDPITRSFVCTNCLILMSNSNKDK